MRRFPLAVLLALAVATPAPAKDAEKARAQPFAAVLECRKLKDDAQRLACYDAATGRMDEAEAKGDIVVIDKAQAEKAHKEAFGLPMPSLDFVTKALKPDEVDKLEGVVKSARQGADDRWTIVLEGGAIWRQISGDLLRTPKSGQKVTIRKGTLGSFLMSVDGQPTIKVHREV